MSITMSLRAPDPPLGDCEVTLRPPDERDLTAIDLGIHDPDVVRWFGQPDSSALDVLALNRRRWANGSPTLSICDAVGVCVGIQAAAPVITNIVMVPQLDDSKRPGQH